MDNGSSQEADRGRGLLLVEYLDVGDPCCIVDGDVDELPADSLRLASAGAGHAMAGACDTDELLHIDVEQLARAASLVAVGRLGPLET